MDWRRDPQVDLRFYDQDMEANTSPETDDDFEPVACTLTSNDAKFQALEWVDLQQHSTAVLRVEDGVRMTLPVLLVDQVEDLARRESVCCAFLSIETSIVGEVLNLEIRSPNPDALPVILALAGVSQP